MSDRSAASSPQRIEVFADCRPPTATAQHKGARIVRRRKDKKLVPLFFTKDEVKAAGELMRKLFSVHAPKAPLSGALYLEVTWTFYWYDYELPLREKGLLPAWVPSTNPPDNDNLVKLFKDVLKEMGFYANDAHVAAEYLRRGRGDRPGIHMVLERYTPDYQLPEGEVPPLCHEETSDDQISL